MNILVTGADGFIGKNLIATLNCMKDGKDRYHKIDTMSETEDLTILPFGRHNSLDELEEYCSKADFVFNLVGINRPKEQSEFMEGNCEFIAVLLNLLKKHHNCCPIMMSSSTQAELDNPYGSSKRAGEELLKKYSKEIGNKIYIYRFPNVFGKWCKPNYNSAIATFCNNIANNLPIQVNDRSAMMNLVYIDDVVNELIHAVNDTVYIDDNGYCEIAPVHKITLGEIVDMIDSFKNSREDRSVPDMTEGGIVKKLYSTYLSYLPTDQFSYPLKMNVDDRGSFTEIIRTVDRGQFSVNISKPNITKGEHWHHTKNEKFVVVSGSGLIQFRKIDSDDIIEYHVSGNKIEVVDIPTGYTHNIINEGDTDMVTFMWCNECFNPEHPDTFFLPVDEHKNK